ncbi:MAG TPA: hypothetical protein VIM41_06310 [Gammaproteobacteria bacterium]
MSTKQLWYTRRGKEIRGPFPAGQITRFILLGRIIETDQLSTDQLAWQPLSNLPDLIPEAMKLDLNLPENREKLRIARLREDEREAGDRRLKQPAHNGTETTRYARRGEDRRKSESTEVIRHREIKTQLLESLREKKKQDYVPRVLGLVFVLSAIFWFARYYV